LLLLFAFAAVVAAYRLHDDICTSDYPPQYIVYKLRPGEKIDLDGRLDEPAWDVAPMTDLVDLTTLVTPYLKTKSVMRYDDKCLYVGAVMEEPQAWANKTHDNTPIFQDNDYEVFIDPGGEYRFYKELEINALRVRWNLLMVRPYMDGGPAVCSTTDATICNATDPEHGVDKPFDISETWKAEVFVDGKVNDPVVGSKMWSLEMCIPIKDVLSYTHAEMPRHNVFWSANIMRVEWNVHTEYLPNGTAYYAKDNEPCHNWAWAPTKANTVHLPDKFGFLQFSEDAVNTSQQLPNPSFPLRKVLMAIYDAEHEYAKHHLTYADSLDILIFEHLFDKQLLNCIARESVSIEADKDTFTAGATSADGSMEATITQDRHFSLQKN